MQRRLWPVVGLMALGALCAQCSGKPAGAEYCGNGVCDSGESVASCPQDCSPTPAACGNGFCEAGETAETCPADCENPTGAVCGNGYCEAGETEATCPNDCQSTTLLGDDCTPEDQRLICVLSDGADGALTGPAGGWTGSAVAVLGDVDGDGYDDLLVGDMQAGINVHYAGAAFLVYGKPDGWSGFSALMDADAVFLGSRHEGYLGNAVSAAGDVNGDGYADFLIGAPNDAGNAVGVGVVYLFFGGPIRYSGTTTLHPDGTDGWLGEVRWRDFDEDGSAGHSLSAAGDLNGDGLGDFLIGAPDYPNKEVNAHGAVYVVYGADFAASPSPRDLATEAAMVLNDQPDNHLGYGLSGGQDLDGDGYDDFVLGNPDHEGDYQHGQALLFYGGPARLSGALAPAAADARFASPDTQVVALGHAVALVGDLDSDGFADLVIGAPYAEQHAGFLYYGSATRWTGEQDVFDADAVLDGPVLSGAGPPITTAGDVNGDGYDDFLIHGNDTSSLGTNIDAAYLYLGGPLRLSGTLPLAGAHAVFLVPADSGNDCAGWAGSGLAGGGDVNGDGYDDFLIGATGFCHGGEESGVVYLVLGGI